MWIALWNLDALKTYLETTSGKVLDISLLIGEGDRDNGVARGEKGEDVCPERSIQRALNYFLIFLLFPIALWKIGWGAKSSVVPVHCKPNTETLKEKSVTSYHH